MGGTRKLEKFTPDAPPAASAVVQEKRAPRDPHALRTRLARKFVSLADEVNERLFDVRIGDGAWAVELTAPDEPSTGGGKRALQHLLVRPRQPRQPGQTAQSAILAGTVNAQDKLAELRTFDHVALVHARRFRTPFEISPADWEHLLSSAEQVFVALEIRATRVSAPKELARQAERSLAEARGRTSASRMALFVLVAVLAVLAIVAVGVMVLRRMA